MNPKLFTTQRTRAVLGLLAMTLMVSACGTKTNPLDGYTVQGVPKSDKINKEQTFTTNSFWLELPATAMVVVEGEPVSFPVKVHSQLSRTQFHLVQSGLPTGLTLDPIDPNNPMGDYAIVGTVPVGTSPSVRSGTNLSIAIQAVEPKSDDSKQVAVFKTAETKIAGVITVLPTKNIPVVEAHAPLSVNEGESVTISLTVKDSGSYGDQVPTVNLPVPATKQSNEVTIISAMRAFEPNPVLAVVGDKSEKRFQLIGTVDTSLLKLPAGKGLVTARVAVQFKSPSQLESAVEYVDINVIRKVVVPPQAPVATNVAPAATNAKNSKNAPPAKVAPAPAPVPAAVVPAPSAQLPAAPGAKPVAANNTNAESAVVAPAPVPAPAPAPAAAPAAVVVTPVTAPTAPVAAPANAPKTATVITPKPAAKPAATAKKKVVKKTTPTKKKTTKPTKTSSEAK